MFKEPFKGVEQLFRTTVDHNSLIILLDREERGGTFDELIPIR